MALLKESDLKAYKTKQTASNESVNLQSLSGQVFDIFLSHSYMDKEIVFSLKNYLEEYGLSVYVDWVDDHELDRESVDAKTALILRKRMNQCRCLLFATSSNSSTSKWMPWECGYFDGMKGKVAILPIATSDETTFNGQEYLGLYPYIDFVSNTIYINSIKSGWCSIKDWLNGNSPD